MHLQGQIFEEDLNLQQHNFEKLKPRNNNKKYHLKSMFMRIIIRRCSVREDIRNIITIFQLVSQYVLSKCVVIDDTICFGDFCCLQKYIKGNEKIHKKWAEYLSKGNIAPNHQV